MILEHIYYLLSFAWKNLMYLLIQKKEGVIKQGVLDNTVLQWMIQIQSGLNMRRRKTEEKRMCYIIFMCGWIHVFTSCHADSAQHILWHTDQGSWSPKALERLWDSVWAKSEAVPAAETHTYTYTDTQKLILTVF